MGSFIQDKAAQGRTTTLNYFCNFVSFCNFVALLRFTLTLWSLFCEWFINDIHDNNKPTKSSEKTGEEERTDFFQSGVITKKWTGQENLASVRSLLEKRKRCKGKVRGDEEFKLILKRSLDGWQDKRFVFRTEWISSSWRCWSRSAPPLHSDTGEETDRKRKTHYAI